jgi:hypothetical protein
MPYAEGRIYNDADSHFMETKDWLFRYADPKVRSKLAPIDFSVCGGQATEDLVTALPGIIERRKRDSAAMARAEDKILERKSWHALGGYDPDERKRAGSTGLQPAVGLYRHGQQPVLGRAGRAAIFRS